MKRTNRAAWGLVLVLTAVLLGALVVLGVSYRNRLLQGEEIGRISLAPRDCWGFGWSTLYMSYNQIIQPVEVQWCRHHRSVGILRPLQPKAVVSVPPERALPLLPAGVEEAVGNCAGCSFRIEIDPQRLQHLNLFTVIVGPTGVGGEVRDARAEAAAVVDAVDEEVRCMADQEDVRRIALALPDTSEGEDHFAFSVGNKGKQKGFVWAWNERIEPKKPKVPRADVVAVRVADQWDKEALLAVDDEKFFTEPHYNGFPAILVRLPLIDLDELEELIVDAWRCQAPRALVEAWDKGEAG
jgi:hypothetical protein